MYFITRLFFFYLNKQTFDNIGFIELMKICWYGVRFDLSAIAWSNLLLIVLHIIPGRFKYSNWYKFILKTLFVVVNGILLTFNLTDAEYFKFIKRRSSAYILDLMGFGNMENDATRQLGLFVVDYWHITLSVVLLYIILIFLYPRKAFKRDFVYLNSFEKIKQFAIIILILGMFVLAARGGFQLKPLRIISASKYVSNNNTPLVLNTPFTIFKTLGKKGLKKRNYFENRSELKYFNSVKDFKNDTVRFNKKNVVVIILESFSQEYSKFLSGNDIGYMPFMDSLMQKSLVFTKGYANGTQSVAAIASVISSLPTLMETPFVSSKYSSNYIESIGSLLKKEGYKTSFFHGGNRGTMGFNNYAKLVGIEDIHDRVTYNNEDHFDGNWGIFDEEFYSYFAKKLDNTQEPFFSYFFSLSSHHPYTMPKKYANKFGKEGKHKILKVVKYSDYALKTFFNKASKSDWYKNTLFVICADHTGPGLSDYYKNRVGRYSVPIIFFDPANDSINRVDTERITQQADILPSVMDYLHFDKKFVAMGNSVFSNPDGFCINYKSGTYLLVHNDYALVFDGKRSLELYNLNNDKLLKNNLLKSDKENKQKLENMCKSIIQQYNDRLMNNKMSLQ